MGSCLPVLARVDGQAPAKSPATHVALVLRYAVARRSPR